MTLVYDYIYDSGSSRGGGASSNSNTIVLTSANKKSSDTRVSLQNSKQITDTLYCSYKRDGCGYYFDASRCSFIKLSLIP
ncbi:hypothetical protein CHS0354_026889 [Potamilus streckersoni]|uniref:Uncharacterized protein n=1 Tax=Potamilus streckersoni TaxID=2493646 RepID=A0AAE0SQD0_9BIVA|nr:hypothetical protein CHS0354_026889 [Potamilus streckersoni]